MLISTDLVYCSIPPMRVCAEWLPLPGGGWEEMERTIRSYWSLVTLLWASAGNSSSLCLSLSLSVWLCLWFLRCADGWCLALILVLLCVWGLKFCFGLLFFCTGPSFWGYQSWRLWAPKRGATVGDGRGCPAPTDVQSRYLSLFVYVNMVATCHVYSQLSQLVSIIGRQAPNIELIWALCLVTNSCYCNQNH
jgi:hypothetical protein